MKKREDEQVDHHHGTARYCFDIVPSAVTKGRCGTANGQHRGGDLCGHPMLGHHRQTPLANRLPHAEDTETRKLNQ